MTAQDQQSRELLPCPFCGKGAHFEHDADGWQWVACESCGMESNRRASLMEDCKPLLSEAWNRRAPAEQAARALPTHQEAKWFLHTLDNTEGIPGNLPYEAVTSSPNHPFGRPGVDFSAEFPVMTRPLYEAPQELHIGRAPLTDEQIEQATGAKRGEPLFLVAKGFTVAVEAAHGIKDLR